MIPLNVKLITNKSAAVKIICHLAVFPPIFYQLKYWWFAAADWELCWAISILLSVDCCVAVMATWLTEGKGQGRGFLQKQNRRTSSTSLLIINDNQELAAYAAVTKSHSLVFYTQRAWWNSGIRLTEEPRVGVGGVWMMHMSSSLFIYLFFFWCASYHDWLTGSHTDMWSLALC